MTFKTARPPLSLSPLALLLLGTAAHADLSPYSFSANESVSHQSNVYRTTDNMREGDWISTTELRAAIDQAIGRDRLVGSATYDLNRYKRLSQSDGSGYALSGAFDWTTVGDLSGAIGADSSRRQYFYGLSGETPSTARNFETDNHAFANVQLGGPSRWTLFSGFDANERRYSAESFAINEERQWSVNAGTRYATSPDLSFGLTGSYTRGTYPNLSVNGASDDFSLKSIDATTKLQASGNSALDARLGYSTQSATGQPANNFVNGALNWTWTPPSHFSINLGLSRDSSADTATGAIASVNNLTGRSINTGGHLDVTYALTAKINLGLSGQYTQRRYSNSVIPVSSEGNELQFASGTNRTTSYGLSAHYLPTRTTDLSCSVAREVRTTDSQIAFITPAYTNKTVMCSAGIRFD